MPEGDALHRIARRLQVLVGERLEVETPHPRTASSGIAERLGGRRLERVEARGKNLLLHFEGGLTLRSHLRMQGRWSVSRRGARRVGTPWLVLRGHAHEAVQWRGPLLELAAGAPPVGPDVLAPEPDVEAIVANLRRLPRETWLGEALLHQRSVSGIGNMWMAEALWEARLSPWLRLGDVRDEELRAAVTTAATLMRDALEGGRRERRAYRRAGRPCRRCGERIRSRGQGDANRSAYWCPRCQPVEAGAAARSA